MKYLISIMLALAMAASAAADVTVRTTAKNGSTLSTAFFTTGDSVGDVSDWINAGAYCSVRFFQSSAGRASLYQFDPDETDVEANGTLVLAATGTSTTVYTFQPSKLRLAWVVDTAETSGTSQGVVICSDVQISGSGGGFDASDGVANGLPTFDTAPLHPQFVLRAGLTSSALTEQGIGIHATTQSPAPSDFTSEGANFDSVKAIYYSITASYPAFQTPLQTRMTMGFELSSEWNTNVAQAANTYLTSISGGYLQWYATSATMRSLYFSTGVTAGNHLYLPALYMPPTRYSLVLTWDETYIDIYVDDLLVSRQDRTGNMTPATGTFYIGGITGTANTAGSWGTRRIKNYFLIADAPRFIESESIGLLGDSFSVTRGCVSQNYSFAPAAHAPLPWATSSLTGGGVGTNTGCGFSNLTQTYANYASTSAGAGNYWGTVARRFSKAGIWTTGNANFAASGAAISSGHFQTHWDLMIAGGFAPTYLLMPGGANDIAQCAGFSQANFETEYEAILAKAFAAGVKRVVGWFPPSLRNNPTYDTAACDTALAQVQASMSTLKQWAIDQGYGSKWFVLADGYNAFGGYDPDASLFDPGDIHPNSDGMYLMGRIIADAALQPF